MRRKVVRTSKLHDLHRFTIVCSILDTSGSWTAGALLWRVILTSATSSNSDSSDSVSNMYTLFSTSLGSSESYSNWAPTGALEYSIGAFTGWAAFILSRPRIGGVAFEAGFARSVSTSCCAGACESLPLSVDFFWFALASSELSAFSGGGGAGRTGVGTLRFDISSSPAKITTLKNCHFY